MAFHLAERDEYVPELLQLDESGIPGGNPRRHVPDRAAPKALLERKLHAAAELARERLREPKR